MAGAGGRGGGLARRGKDAKKSIFDVPAGFSESLLGPAIVENLALKGFCVIDLGLESGLAEQAVKDANAIRDEKRTQLPPPELVGGLLGPEGTSLMTQLPQPDPLVPEEELETSHALWKLDLMMSDIGMQAQPYVTDLGFDVEDRSAALVHWTEASDSAALDPEGLMESECQRWLAELPWTRLMVLIFLGPGKGSLEMAPLDDEDANAHRVPTQPGMMVVLRTDVLSHLHFPMGDDDSSLALSCFFMQSTSKPKPPPTPTVTALTDWMTKKIKVSLDKDEWDPAAPRDFQHLASHKYHYGPRVAVTGIQARLASTWEVEAYGAACVHGPDLTIEVEGAFRWQHLANNYDAEPESWRWYKTNIKHGSFVEGIQMFDNKFFSLSDHEAKGMDPSQRWCLEGSHELLIRSGMKPKEMRKSHVAVYVGFSSGEWNEADDKSEEVRRATQSGTTPCIYSNRVSFSIGLIGPSITIDQEAASGLTAVHLSSVAVMDCWPDGTKKQGQVCKYGLGVASYFILSSFGLVKASSAGFLGSLGRCCAFDESAAGPSRGEGIAGACVKQYTRLIDNEWLVDADESPPQAVLASTGTNQSGMCSHIAGAPDGPALTELISELLIRAKVNALDVDAMEVHGEGRQLPDLVDVCTALGGTRGGYVPGSMKQLAPLPVFASKTTLGHTKETSGAIALTKIVLHGQICVAMPNLHLRTLNPNMDCDGFQGLACLQDEVMPFGKKGSSYVGIVSHGHGGSNSSTLVWNNYDIQQKESPEARALAEPLTYWPAGGGDIDEDPTLDCRNYHIVGSWTQWADTEIMEAEGEDTWGFTVILGENCWEQFQIWLDGDSGKALHPGHPGGAKNEPVVGPDDDFVARGNNWMIDGRDRVVPTPGGPGDAEGEGQPLVSMQTTDKAKPGDAFRVRLHLAGKWKVVTWEKILDIEDTEARAPEGSYWITGSFNNWSFEEMEADASPGLYSVEVMLYQDGGAFQIARNRDWSQVFYPAEIAEAGAEPGAPQDAQGPDDQGHGQNWSLEGLAGDVFKILFQRTREEGRDVRTISWWIVRREEKSIPQLISCGMARIWIIGSWNEWADPHEMVWDGDGYVTALTIGEDGLESFHLLLGGSDQMAIYPNRPDACPQDDHHIEGPDSWGGGRFWTIGAHRADYDAEGAEYKVTLNVRGESQADWRMEWERIS